MSHPRSAGRWSTPLGWLVGALLLLAIAVIAGLGAARLVTIGQAVPTVDPSRFVTPTPPPTPSPEPSPTATPAPTTRPTARPTATPAATPTASPTSAATPRTHVVARGETLRVIAARYGVTVESIVALNNLANPDLIVVGQVLLIPPPP
jgi:LysM repeat protein